MKETRRTFIKTAAAGAVLTAGAPAVALAKGAGLDRPVSAFSLSAADLAPYVGTSFKVSCNGTSSKALLKSVEEVRASGARPNALPRRDAFVAVFDGVDPAAFDQQISVVEHAKLGRMDLMLGATDSSQLTAVFN